MTVMIAEFFGMPHSLVRTGKLRLLNGTAVSVLVALWHESERACTRELTRTDKQLVRLVKAHRNSIAAARRELKNAGLVVAEPFGSSGFVYLLCDPNTGEPWPGSPEVGIKYVPKVGTPRLETGIGEATRTGSQARRRPKTILKSELAGTSFPFGANAPPKQEPERSSNASTPSTSTGGLHWDKLGSR
jgi:hypothetical protein